MPGMDGLRTLRALKNDRATASIPVVAVSVLGDPVQGDLTLGAFSFGQKPLSPADIRLLIAASCGGSGNGQALAVCGADTPLCQDLHSAAPALAADYGVALTVLEAAPEAVAFVVTQAPSVILLDTDLLDADLFALLSALQAETEAAHITIVLLTDDIAPTGLPLSAGAGGPSTGLDMLCEQLSRAMPIWEMPVK